MSRSKANELEEMTKPFRDTISIEEVRDNPQAFETLKNSLHQITIPFKVNAQDQTLTEGSLGFFSPYLQYVPPGGYILPFTFRGTVDLRGVNTADPRRAEQGIREAMLKAIHLSHLYLDIIARALEHRA